MKQGNTGEKLVVEALRQMRTVARRYPKKTGAPLTARAASLHGCIDRQFSRSNDVKQKENKALTGIRTHSTTKKGG
jgi:hypothetical protein